MSLPPPMGPPGRRVPAMCSGGVQTRGSDRVVVAPLPSARPAWAIGALAWVDRLVGSDPGLGRLRLGLMGAAMAAAALGGEALLLRKTGALQVSAPSGRVSPAQLAAVAAQHHLVLVVGMLVGAVFALLSTIGVVGPDPRKQVLSTAAGGGVLIGAFAAGLALGGHRVWGMVLLVFSLAVGTYTRRFGPDWLLAGLALFIGSLFGTALYGPLRVQDMGWVAAEVGLAAAAGLCVRLTLFSRRAGWTLRRIEASYRTRARKVAQAALEALADPGRGDSRLRRELARLNETALMIDVQLTDPRSLPAGASAESVHRLFFEAELALTSIVRHAETLARADLNFNRRTAAANPLRAIRDGDLMRARAAAVDLLVDGDQVRSPSREPIDDDRAVRAIVHRYAEAVISFADSMAGWSAVDGSGRDGGTFTSPVQLSGGRLTGTAVPGAKASLGNAVLGRFRLRLTTRSAIQIAVAAALAIMIADQVSSSHYFWAVTAVFVTFMGTNHSREQFYRAFYRAAGTLVGVAIGLGVGHALGRDHTFGLVVVVLVSVFVTAYFVQINYGIAMAGITVAISMVYVQLGEFSNSLLLTRLEVTAIGAAVAAAVAITVIPLRAGSVIRVALQDQLLALRALLRHVSERVLDKTEDGVALRFDARRLGAADQALGAAAASIALDAPLLGGVNRRLVQATEIAGASRHFAHDLMVDSESVRCLDDDVRRSIGKGWQRLDRSLAAIANAMTQKTEGTYLRSSAYFDEAERLLEGRPDTIGAQRMAAGFVLIDRGLAELAEIAGLDVKDVDLVNPS